MKSIKMIFLLFIFLFTSVSTPLAVENEKVLTPKINVDPLHTFTVKFNKKIDENTVNYNTIMVKDNKGVQLSQKIEVETGNKIVKVIAPKQGYQEGQTYTLYVTKGVKYLNGKRLKQATSMKFTVKVNTSFLGLVNTKIDWSTRISDLIQIAGEPVFKSETSENNTYHFTNNDLLSLTTEKNHAAWFDFQKTTGDLISINMQFDTEETLKAFNEIKPKIIDKYGEPASVKDFVTEGYKMTEYTWYNNKEILKIEVEKEPKAIGLVLRIYSPK